MIDVIGVRFATKPKSYYFNPNGDDFAKGDVVIVETARGVEHGKVVMEKKQISEDELVAELKPVLRKATEGDLAQIERNNADEKTAFGICAEQIERSTSLKCGSCARSICSTGARLSSISPPTDVWISGSSCVIWPEFCAHVSNCARLA